MQRRTETWRWDDPEAQASFVEWVGFPSAAESAEEVTQLEALVGLQPDAAVKLASGVLGGATAGCCSPRIGTAEPVR